MANEKVHEGRNVKRIREILGVKQEALALDLGLSQQAISQLEQKEALEADLLDKIARALKVSPEAIKNFNEAAAFNIIGNSYHDQASSINYQCTFNPIEKIVELYERLLKSEKEKNELLEKLFQEKK